MNILLLGKYRTMSCKDEFVLTNAPIAMRMGAINELAEKTASKIIPADATSGRSRNFIF